MLSNLQTTILNSLPIFAILILVINLRDRKILHPNTKEVLRPIVFKLVLPFFVFKALYGLEVSTRDFKTVGLLLITTLILIILTLVLFKFLKLSKPVKSAMLITLLGYQVGPFAYPFVQLNFTDEVFKKVVVLDIALFVLIMILAPIIASVYNKSEEKINLNKIVKAILKDLVLQTVLLTTILNITDAQISSYVLNIVDFLAKPFAFLTLTYLAFSLKLPDKNNLKNVMSLFFLRNICLLLISFILISLFISDIVLRQALLLTVFVPFSSFALVYTDKYEIDEETIIQLSITSLLIFIFLYPIVVTIAKGF